jgi:hypothetical protein
VADDARRATLTLTKDGFDVLAAAHRFATYLRRPADQQTIASNRR